MDNKSPKVIKLNQKDIVAVCQKLIESKSKKRLDEQVVTDHDHQYHYKKDGDHYYYKNKSDLTWILAKDKILTNIKSNVFNEKPVNSKVILKSKVSV